MIRSSFKNHSPSSLVNPIIQPNFLEDKPNFFPYSQPTAVLGLPSALSGGASFLRTLFDFFLLFDLSSSPEAIGLMKDFHSFGLWGFLWDF